MKHCLVPLTHISLASLLGDQANSVDPDQGLHCLLTEISIQSKIKMKKYIRHPLNEK